MIQLFVALCLYGTNNCTPVVAFPAPFHSMENCEAFVREVVTRPDRPPMAFRWTCGAQS